METHNQKIVRIEQSPHDSAPIHWIEFPAYRVELSIDPTDRTTASCGMDWITVSVWDCTHGGSGEFLFSDEILADDWDANGAESVNEIAYLTALDRQPLDD